MTVSEIMIKKVKTVALDASVKTAVLIMNKYNIGSVVVVAAGKPIGIITERDILRRIVALNKHPEKILCKKIMSRPLKTISPNDKLVEAIERMSKNTIKKLIVTEKGVMVGILSVTDIIRSGEKMEDEALKKLAHFYPICRPADDEKPFT